MNELILLQLNQKNGRMYYPAIYNPRNKKY